MGHLIVTEVELKPKREAAQAKIVRAAENSGFSGGRGGVLFACSVKHDLVQLVFGRCQRNNPLGGADVGKRPFGGGYLIRVNMPGENLCNLFELCLYPGCGQTP